tara:strand:- start:65 stop:478 length:414 start_codon:yes stop_codon:yes gene_type:complete
MNNVYEDNYILRDLIKKTKKEKFETMLKNFELKKENEKLKVLTNQFEITLKNKEWRLSILKKEEHYRYAIKLPYTQETKDFIKCFRALGKIQGFTIRVRGGGSISPKFRKDGLNLRHMDRGLPLKYAETVRLYVDFK